MTTTRLVRGLSGAALLSILTGVSLGCNDAPPNSPTEVSVTSVLPDTGPAASSTELSISGFGFEPGASVTVGGAATSVRVIRSTLILAITPISPAGTVDVVVTNPGGRSSRLAGAFTYFGLLLTDIVPTRGLPGDVLRIRGAAFSAGAVLTIGGVASAVIARTGTELTALAPFLPPGIVEVAVTNPSGERRTLSGGFTVEAVAISASPSTVTIGDPLSVSYEAPNQRLPTDWVGLFRFGDPNENLLWYEYTGGASRKTITIPAPDPPGDYEFRYLADDGYIDAARTGVVRVIRAGANALGTASSRGPATRPPAFPLIRPGRGRGK
jgi:hypothetical protein